MSQAESIDSRTPLEPSVLDDHRVLIGDLVLDTDARTIQSRGMRTVKLSSNEFSILAVLANSPGRTVAKDDLLHAVAGTEIEPHPSIVDTYIKYLHRQLLEAKSAVTIQKVPGVGFSLRP